MSETSEMSKAPALSELAKVSEAAVTSEFLPAHTPAQIRPVDNRVNPYEEGSITKQIHECLIPACIQYIECGG